MGFYSVVTLTSGALLSCLVTTRSQLTTVTPDMFTVKYGDDYWTTKRLLRADVKIAADSEEERVLPGLVADFTMQGRRPVNWDVIKGMGHPRFSDTTFRPQGDTKKELVQYLMEAFQMTLWDHKNHKKIVEAEKLLETLSEHFGHDILAYVLTKIEALHGGIRNYAKDYHHQYLEWMIKQGRTPSNVLELWNKEGIPLSTVVENLHEFIELYNIEKGKTTTVFEILKSVFEDQKKMVQELSSLKREGDTVEDELHTDMVRFLHVDKTFDEVFELTRPEADNEKWSFDTLYKFAELSGINTLELTQTLMHKFGGYDKLAPVLAEAKWYHDEAAEDLQVEIVRTFIEKNYKLEQAVRELNLQEGAQNNAELDTLLMFLALSKTKHGMGDQIE